MKLTFLGATGTVTGSKYLLEDGQRILIDCGLFQGLKALRLRNWAGFPVDPASIHAVLLTHAHLDHSGYLPRLVKAGFRGKIYCSEATFELCKILLPDSGRIQEEDAERANRYHYTKHAPALPLYTEQEARDCLPYFSVVDFGKPCRLGEFLTFTLQRAGHILGASSIRISDGQTSILFSGDIGRLNDPVMKAPVWPEPADYLVVESTYGNRLHDPADVVSQLAETVNRTIRRGGTLIIPAFAVGRAQLILYYLHRLKAEKRIPDDLPVYLDSPMAINVSELLCRFPQDHRLNQHLCEDVCASTTYVRTREESQALDHNGLGAPAVIISASGMITGGRVLHHLKHFMGSPRNTVLLAGYQAEGTRGDRLLRHEREIRIHGQMFPVMAEVVQLDSLSAHADYAELLEWMHQMKARPRKVFITHGERAAAESLQQKLKETLGWDAVIPDYLQTVEL